MSSISQPNWDFVLVDVYCINYKFSWYSVVWWWYWCTHHFCFFHLQPSPSTSSLSSNHSASPNVTSSAPSSARGESGTQQHHNSLLADISIHTEEADRGSAGQSEPLTFHWHNVLSIHRSILSGEVREVRWRLGINAEEVDRGKKREQWGGSIEWIVRAWNIDGIQNESKERKGKEKKVLREMLLKETWS